MTRVLILTASYGSGHNAAARALAAAFERARAEVHVVDHFRELVSPAFDRATRALYHALLRRAPLVWGCAYALGDRLGSESPLTFGASTVGVPKLAALLARLSPDAVVTTHATPALALSTLVGQGVHVPPHTTVVTDFVAHSQWIAPRVDRYCVAADEVRHEFMSRGIPGERVVVTGMPVRPEFGEPVSPVAARSVLGLHMHAPVVLAMAGAYGGFGRLPDVARALPRLERPLQAVLVAGHDARLETKLRRMTRGAAIRVLGWVPDVRRLMAAADLLVTKAGGLTLAEAIAAELPVLAYGSLPGQERKNEHFAARVGIGLVARSRMELGRTLERALGEPELLEQIRGRMRRLRRPDATGRIVALVLERARRAAP